MLGPLFFYTHPGLDSNSGDLDVVKKLFFNKPILNFLSVFKVLNNPVHSFRL